MRRLHTVDEMDRRIVNSLQGGFPLSDRPYADVAAELGLTEAGLIERLSRMLRDGTLTRFGPMYNAEAMGGALTLCAMEVPEPEFEQVAGIVNGYREVAHNYRREHPLNMWFVLATETHERQAEVLGEIRHRTGIEVLNLPRIEEYFVGLRFVV